MTITAKTKSRTALPGRDDHVLALCHMLSNRIGNAFAAELARHDISVAEWRVMLTLARHDGASGREITVRWAMEKMAVNRAISNLERRGALVKKQNSRDRRAVDVMLTTSGRAMYEKLLPVANRRYRKLMAGLDGREQTTLRDLLIKMIAHADAVAK